MPIPTDLTVREAQEVLQVFTCLETGIEVSPPAPGLVRQALLLVASLSDYQMLGVCASNLPEGLSVLGSYLKALGYDSAMNVASVEGPVYLKFNAKTGLCYAEPYVGAHRGVLVSCQSSIQGGINDMYGHLPLDLFLTEA